MEFNFLKKTAAKRIAFFVAADVFFVALSIWVAFLLRFDGAIPALYFPYIWRIIVLLLVFIVPVFFFEKLYFFSWSYVSTAEIIALVRATSIAFVLLGIGIFVSDYFPQFLNFPRSTLGISYVLVLVLCGGLRFSKRVYLNINRQKNADQNEKTLVVGAGDAGEQIVRSMLSQTGSAYLVAGFVDDSPMKKGVKIHGFPVLGKIADIPQVVSAHQVRQIIIALPSAGNAAIRRAIELAKSAGVKKIKIAPPLSEIMRGEVSLKNLREVGVEDLLGRDQILLDKKQIEQYIKNNVVLITGAAGSIGSELSLQVAAFKPSLLVVLDQDETGIFSILASLKEKFADAHIQPLVADIGDRQKINQIFKQFAPSIVFHAAAYKHVPLMEAQPDEAIKNNIFGTKVLAEASIDNGVGKFIFISTDKAVNPTSVMGATKRISEMLCQAYSQQNVTKFISVRFGNVLNSRGSVIPIFKEQIRRGGPVQVTHPDMQRYFMLTSEACLLVMQAGAMGQGGEVFVLDMGKPVKIVDLAKEMIRLSGFEPDRDIAIVFTGVRPGEKLFEEMLTEQEGVVATQNQKIFIAKMADVDSDAIRQTLDALEDMIYKKEITEIVAQLKRIVSNQ